MDSLGNYYAKSGLLRAPTKIYILLNLPLNISNLSNKYFVENKNQDKLPLIKLTDSYEA